jgi:hypothetical protein
MQQTAIRKGGRGAWQAGHRLRQSRGRAWQAWHRGCLPALLCAVSCQDNTEPVALSFEPVAVAGSLPTEQAQHSAPAYRIFDAPAAWESYCQKSLGQTPSTQVDFASEIIIGVYAGEKPTGGYGIAITAMELRGGVVQIMLEETQPPAGAMLIQVITNPYALYRVTLPPGTRGDIDVASLQVTAIRSGDRQPMALQHLD